MTAADQPMSDPGRGGLKAVRWRRFLQDFPAVHEAARGQGVVTGTYRADELREHGVGVVQLWFPSPPRLARAVPLGIQAFQATMAPPAATLWAAATTRERITASLHIEFVGGIARICEAVDIQADGVGREYILRLEPVDAALTRCLDVLGFGAPLAGAHLTRLRASFPWRWPADGNRREHVAAEHMRDLVVRFSCPPGATPVVDQQLPAHCPDVPALPAAPTRTDVAAALDAFFAGAPAAG